VLRRLADVEDGDVWITSVVDVDVHAAARRNKTRIPVEDRRLIQPV